MSTPLCRSNLPFSSHPYGNRSLIKTRPKPGNGFDSQKCDSDPTASGVGHLFGDKKKRSYSGFRGEGSGQVRSGPIVGDGLGVAVALDVAVTVGIAVTVGVTSSVDVAVKAVAGASVACGATSAIFVDHGLFSGVSVAVGDGIRPDNVTSISAV
jgi:hypothetical protein